MSVVLSEHLPLLASAPNGIQKLRGLILELAVRGKLVPQDPKDEPASELLKRIAKERAQLEMDGKIKKVKPLPPVGDDKRPFALPEGWKFSRLGELLLGISSGGTPSKNNPAFWDGDIPWASVKDLGFGEPLTDTQDRITAEGLEAGSFLAVAGSILVCTRMGLGKIGEALIDVAINQDLKALRLSSAINKRYFVNFFKTLSITGSGMTVAGIKQDELLEFVVATPPLPEQHRIVAKVDELMALCDRLEQEVGAGDTAHARLVEALLGTLTQSADATELAANWQRLAEHFNTLFTTESSLDALKQTVLQLAVRGKLVPQDAKDEPASELLKRIEAEKTKLVASGKVKKDKPSRPLGQNEITFDLPTGWALARLQAGFDVRDGTHDTPKYVEKNGVPLITSKNFVNGSISFDDAKLISNSDHESIKKRSGVTNGDILYSMIGGNIGNQVLVDTDREFSIKNVALFKYYAIKDSSPQFLNLFLKTVTFGIQAQAAGGAQPFVSLSFLRNVPIALPPLAEQHRIVAKVDELMALCDRLKADLAESRTRQARLSATLIESALQAA